MSTFGDYATRYSSARIMDLHSYVYRARVITHEAKQPLTTIANFAAAAHTVIERKQLAEFEDLAHWLTRISEESLHCGAILDELRTFSGIVTDEPRPWNVAEIIEHALEIVQPRLTESEIRVEVELDEPMELACVGTHLLEILVRLLHNAIETTDHSLQTRATTDPGSKDLDATGLNASTSDISLSLRMLAGQPMISVQDFGEGMSDELLEKAFRMGFTTRPGASGVGLPICHDLAEANGWEILLQGNPDGTTVRLVMP